MELDDVSEAHEVHLSVEARKRKTLDKPLLARPLSDAIGSQQGLHRTAGPSRALRWSLAAVLGLALLSLPLPARALFAPAPIHKTLFHLDESSGISTADAVSGTNACLGPTVASPCPVAGSSSPTWTPDARYGSALRFDGVDDTLTFAHSTSLNWAATNNHVVIEAWIKPTQAGTILSKGGASHNYRLAIDAAGNLIFSYTDTKGKLRQLASPLGGGQAAPVSFVQWHWVSVSFSEDWTRSRCASTEGRRGTMAKLVYDGSDEGDPFKMSIGGSLFVDRSKTCARKREGGEGSPDLAPSRTC